MLVNYDVSKDKERQVSSMNFVLVIALIVGLAVCLLPVVMAWSFHFGGQNGRQRIKKPFLIG